MSCKECHKPIGKSDGRNVKLCQACYKKWLKLNV
jgi:hypothetical protein